MDLEDQRERGLTAPVTIARVLTADQAIGAFARVVSTSRTRLSARWSTPAFGLSVDASASLQPFD
jgi:hypothetical protein